MFYFSSRALNELDDARRSLSTTTNLGLSKLFSFSRSSVQTLAPGSSDDVDFVLKRSRRFGRHIIRDPWDAVHTGSVMDIDVEDLEVGVMPFSYFGTYGEGAHLEKVRTFWGHSRCSPRALSESGPSRELVLLGSIDNIVNGGWSAEDENKLQIGHDYPSDPSALARLVKAELNLRDESVEEHIRAIETFEVLDSGSMAQFAWSQTERATKSVIIDEGFARSWQRRLPLRRARVVASVSDLYVPESDEESSVLLARPILIQDLT